jgi:hypothetical protein
LSITCKGAHWFVIGANQYCLAPSPFRPPFSRNPIMSGVEALLGLSLLSSTISIVDETKKVYDSAKDAGGFPKAFREVAAQLPLVAETLYSLRHYVQEGNISEDSYNEITPVVKDCEAKAKELYDLFMKVTPRGNASASDRYSLTVRALGKGNLAMNLIQGMLKDIQFLAQAANVNSPDGYGQTALHLAAEKGALTVVENLIRRGADINVRDKYGRTALHLAARDGASNVVELLLSQGADATIATLEGETARDLADKKNITKLFDDPPIVDGETSTTEDAQRKQVRPVPPKNKDREDICRKMSASVRYFSGRKKKEYTVPVFDLIYEGDRLSADEAKQLLVSKADMKKEITAAEHDKLPDRWIHLPANNVRASVLG